MAIFIILDYGLMAVFGVMKKSHNFRTVHSRTIIFVFLPMFIWSANTIKTTKILLDRKIRLQGQIAFFPMLRPYSGILKIVITFKPYIVEQ